MKLEDIVWSTTQWELIAEGGMWVIPAVGLVMQRTAKGFSLYSLIPVTGERLAQQKEHFNLIREHFEAAGLDFDDPKGLLNDHSSCGN